MLELPQTKTAYFDVDDTLVMWDCKLCQDNEDKLVGFDFPGVGYMTLLPHYEHMAKLRWHKERGDAVVVWSQGGGDWAAEVVRKLRLESYVDVCITKPTRMYDDLLPGLWMPRPRYLDGKPRIGEQDCD